jgi:hypothetical protein
MKRNVEGSARHIRIKLACLKQSLVPISLRVAHILIRTFKNNIIRTGLIDMRMYT